MKANKMKVIVTEIQVGGGKTVKSLEDAFREYLKMRSHLPKKIHFAVKLLDGKTASITMRQEANQVVAYGSFNGLQDFLEYSKEVESEN